MVAPAADGYERRDEGLTSIEYGQGPMEDRTPLAKATPKSLRTRARILEASMQLFVEIGYHAATNAVIADAAHLTRGAMLYHFATREDLVEAAIEYIELRRIDDGHQLLIPEQSGNAVNLSAVDWNEV